MSTLATKWSLEADFLQACNCDYGCPCEFAAPPTMGFCEGLGAWKIDKGDYDGLSLGGLALGFAAKWPGAIHEGNGTVCLFISDNANPFQREALVAIGSGQAGGLPFEILATTFSTLLDPQFVPFEFNIAGVNSSVDIGGKVRITLESIKNPVTREPEQVAVNHGTGFVFKTADCASAREGRVDVENLSFSYPDKAGFISRIRYGN